MKLPEYIPTAVVNLDRPRTTALTNAAQRRIRPVAGKNITDEATDLMDLIGVFIWGLLVDEDRADVTVEDIENMIYPGNMAEMIRAVSGLVQESTPVGKA